VEIFNLHNKVVLVVPVLPMELLDQLLLTQVVEVQVETDKETQCLEVQVVAEQVEVIHKVMLELQT
jgi:hypothetical protein